MYTAIKAVDNLYDFWYNCLAQLDESEATPTQWSGPTDLTTGDLCVEGVSEQSIGLGADLSSPLL